MYLKRYEILNVILGDKKIKGLLIEFERELNEETFWFSLGKIDLPYLYSYLFSDMPKKIENKKGEAIIVKEEIDVNDITEIEYTNRFISEEHFKYPEIKCISCDIFKPHSGDCSNNGLSSSYNKVYLINEEGNLNFNILDDDCPQNIVEYFYECEYDIYKSIPLFSSYHSVWYMYGGTFIYTCDSRFRSKYKYPVPLHDRIER